MNLEDIVELVRSCQTRVDSGTLFCYDYIIKESSLLVELEQTEILNSPITSKKIGDKINLEFSLAYLESYRFFEDWSAVVHRYMTEFPTGDLYVLGIDKYASEDGGFFGKYQAVIDLVNGIETVARHCFTEVGVKKCVIHREDKSIFLSIKYSASTVARVTEEALEKIQEITRVLKEPESEKKRILINELIEFTYSIEAEHTIAEIIDRILLFGQRYEQAYQYYLRNFSYNKLRIELDSKTLEFTQKIQTVISEAQTKLIAIPSAFVLVGVTLDFDNAGAIRNYVVLFGLLVFAILLEIFIRNQKSALKFIYSNIQSYKEGYKNQNSSLFNSRFKLVETELNNQRSRLKFIELILWSLTGLLTVSFVLVSIGISFYSIFTFGVALVVIVWLVLE